MARRRYNERVGLRHFAIALGFVATLLICGCEKTDVERNAGLATPPAPKKSAPVVPADDPNAWHDISLACQGQRIPVIMYHDVIPERGPGSVWFDATTDEFEEQMKWIKDHGATPISLQDLYDHLTKGKEVPDGSIVITFDDNYQGFYDHAVPILRKYQYPAAMFVHTGYVGDKEHGRPKMTWDELKELSKDPLFTIESHTVTHPADITKLSPEDQEKELNDSKAALEQHLGKSIDFLAYPDGNNNSLTQSLAKAAGYKMAFSTHNQPAEESPNILCVGRYVQTKMDKAWDDRDLALRGGVLGVFRHVITSGPVSFQEQAFGGINLALVTGGTPMSLLSDTRETVLDFLHRTPGAVAGINGGFFAMAAIASTDNRMVGPCKTGDQPAVTPDTEQSRWMKLRNRPIVMWGPSDFAIVPYIPEQTVDPDTFKTFMPDVSDVFLAGVWLVHNGLARSEDDMNVFASKDIQDPRRRAFMGIMPDGRMVIGASTESVPSSKLAEGIAAAGIQEAVLLDSGFSTSLVYGEKVMASGHSTPDKPSRPVPHAILLKGDLDPNSTAAALAAKPATDPIVAEAALTHRHRRRRKKDNPDVTALPSGPPDTSPPTTGPPDTAPPTTGPPDTSPPTDGPPNIKPPDEKPPQNGPPDVHPPDKKHPR
jgi:peptidoglycan/xylan/chitin deacetylase (PgdA/CDA1 family)